MNGVSLFANVGIAETYVKNHNINIVVANELLKNRAEFYKEHYEECHMICGDIADQNIYRKVLKEAKEQKCEFILATPPCQGMSIAGKMREDDPRNSLIKYVVKFIKDLQPLYVIIENVSGMLKTYLEMDGEKIKIVDYIKNELEKFNYFINYRVVDSADYGVPQTRKRAIFLISKRGVWNFPEKQRQITVEDAIGKLPSLESGEKSNIPYHSAKKHNSRHILWLKHTPTGKTAFENKVYYPQKEDGTKIRGYKTTYKRMSWDKPAPTITMSNGSISSQNNVHPGRLRDDGSYSDARVLTLKEIFILSGLPEDWTPPQWASENFVREVIGEGIPPKLIDNLLKTMPKRE
jgi:DNA (cytosine-5)-methyltransferase 1